MSSQCTESVFIENSSLRKKFKKFVDSDGLLYSVLIFNTITYLLEKCQKVSVILRRLIFV